MTTKVEFIDPGGQGEYGFFGKCVAKLDTIGMSDEMIEKEIAEMKAILGDHVYPVYVTEVPAV